MTRNLSSKYSQKRFHHAKQFARDVFKTTSKKIFKKQQKQLVIRLAIKISDKIAKVSITSLQNGSGATSIETENIGLDREIPRERYKKTDMQL